MRKLLPIILILCLLPMVTNAAISFDASSTASLGSSGGTTATSSITVGSGSNEAVIVIIPTNSNSSPIHFPSSVSIGGVAATQLFVATTTNSLDSSLAVFYRLNVSAGTYIVSSTFSGTSHGGFFAVSLFGVNQSTPFEATTTTSTANHVNSGTNSITTLTNGDYILDGLTEDVHDSATTTGVTNSGQIIINQNIGDTTGKSAASYLSVPTAGATTTGWNFSTSTSFAYLQAAVVPAAAPATSLAPYYKLLSYGW